MKKFLLFSLTLAISAGSLFSQASRPSLDQLLKNMGQASLQKNSYRKGFNFFEDKQDSLLTEYTWDDPNGVWQPERRDSLIWANGQNTETYRYIGQNGVFEKSERDSMAFDADGNMVYQQVWDWDMTSQSWARNWYGTFTYNTLGQPTDGTLYGWNGTAWFESGTLLAENTTAQTIFSLATVDSTGAVVDTFEHTILKFSNEMLVGEEIYKQDSAGVLQPYDKYDLYRESDGLRDYEIWYTWQSGAWKQNEKYEFTNSGSGMFLGFDKYTWDTFGWNYSGKSYMETSYDPGSRMFSLELYELDELSGNYYNNTKTMLYTKATDDGTYCNNYIHGYVSPPNEVKNLNYNDMVVVLYNTAGYNRVVDSSRVDSTGHYFFMFQAAGNFVVKAKKKASATYPSILNTFHGPALRWNFADIIALTCERMSKQADIPLINLTTLAKGNANIYGTVLFSNATKSGIHIKTTDATGEPVPGAEIILEQEPDENPVGFTISDENGSYSFDSIPQGQYSIEIDLPGIPQLSTYEVDVDSEGNLSIDGQAVADLDFVVDTATGQLQGEDTSLTRPEPTRLYDYRTENHALKVLPNPFSNVLAIELQSNKEGRVHIRLFDQQGRLMKAQEAYANIGQQRISLDGPGHLPPGTYYLSIQIGGEVYVRKLIKQ